MSQVSGFIRKLSANLSDVVQYELPLGDQKLALNPLIGNDIRLEFLQEIRCVACDRKTNKSFNQGYCYPCFRSLAQCDSCIMSPHKCHFEAGTCREPDWGQTNCMIDHYVYLANTSGLKVGITRHTQIPTRWIDQGATQALPIARVSSRYLSGVLEVELAKTTADKTAWQAMLKGPPEPLDLEAQRDRLLSEYASTIEDLQSRFGLQSIQPLLEAATVNITFPITEYPDKVKAFNLDKEPVVEGRLVGIKGQYLILDTWVLNLRKYGGYRLAIDY